MPVHIVFSSLSGLIWKLLLDVIDIHFGVKFCQFAETLKS